MTAQRMQLHILQSCSSGTFADVYMAESISPEGERQLLAIKALKEKWLGDQELLNRFNDEAYLLRTLHHPNILHVQGASRAAVACQTHGAREDQ